MVGRLGLAIVSIAAVLALVAVLPAGATFSGTNGRITFARVVPNPDPTKGHGTEIFSAKPDGSEVTQLTFSGFDEDGNAHTSFFSDWSPDGSKIAFDTDRTSTAATFEVQVFTMNWDGSAPTQLTSGPGFHVDPAWSPSGDRIAIEAEWGDYPAQEGIWTIPATDSDGVTMAEAERVTTLPAGMDFDSEPQYSPDGNWIAFTRFKSCKVHERGHLAFISYGCTQAIFRVHTDGTGLERLTPWGRTNSAPDWSPDGTKIAFDSCDSAKLGCKGGIYVMKPDGTKKTRIIDSPTVGDAGHDFSDFRFDSRGNPVWSPDGSKLMYVHWLDVPLTELVTVSAEGSGETPVVDGGFFDNKVDWGTHP